MLKIFITLFSFCLTSTLLAAKPCKVYGITDSPQGLQCHFPGSELHLSCVKGKYFLNTTEVSVAYHLEVQSGTVPLVFKSPDKTLTVMMDSPIEAVLIDENSTLTGTCQSLR